MTPTRIGMWHRAIEPLESRQLLAVSLDGLTAISEEDAVATTANVTRESSPAPPVGSLAVSAVQVDAASVRSELIRFVDTWNGGQAGRLGTNGMGAYALTWDGLFRMNLDRQFNPISYYTNDQTIISQSRAIYMNVEAYRNSPATDRVRFKTAVQKGADLLLAKSVDPATYNAKGGGMWWGLQSDGVSPPTHTTQIGGTLPRHKNAYGQVQAIFALAHAYTITADVDHLNAAFAQLDVWNGQFADTAAGPGAFLPTANEDYSQRVDTRNLDYITHALEALLALDAATPTSHTRKGELASQITNIGNFITARMYRDAAGSTTMGYLPWYYDARWNPSAIATQQYMTPGHNLEVAFLLSRAVEQGFSSSWLNVANKLITFALKYGVDNVPGSLTYGAVRHDKLKFDGTPFNTTPDNLIWWQASENARTLLHFATIRGRTDLADDYDRAIAFIRSRFIDPVYGGWFTSLDPSTLAPTTTNKGTVWTGGYHESMLYAEMLRLAPSTKSTPFFGTPVVISSTGSTIVQAENFDNGGEGISFHDIDGTNSGNAYRTTGVDVQATSDVGGGYNIGWTKAGEWLAYTATVPAAASYNIDFRVASPAPGGTFHLQVDGNDVTGPLVVPNTGGWQTWKTISKGGVMLAAGTHVLRLRLDRAGDTGSVGNFNYIKFTPASAVSIGTQTATYVRDGTYAGQSFGSSTVLELKKNVQGFNREIYLKFDVSAVASISSAKLRLYGRLNDADTKSIALQLFEATDVSWPEALTWKTRPTASQYRGQITIAGTTAAWHEIDVTAVLKEAKAGGRQTVTLVLRSNTFANTLCTFSSDEASANWPRLLVTP